MIIDMKKIIVLSVMTGILCFSCSKLNQWMGYEDDAPNSPEEVGETIVEHLIKDKIGLDVNLDFTPSTPE